MFSGDLKDKCISQPAKKVVSASPGASVAVLDPDLEIRAVIQTLR